MGGGRELKRRLKSVQNTKKITYAMKLVSAAKLRRAQESVARSREYTSAINGLLCALRDELSGADFTHALLQKKETVKNIRLVVVGGSRGLCGAYNSAINKRAEEFLREKKASGSPVTLEAYLIGKKPAEYFRRAKREYVKSYETLPDDANRWPIHDICCDLEDGFISGQNDEVYLIYTKFKSALSMTVLCDKLLPLDADAMAGAASEAPGIAGPGSGSTLFEPSAREVFAALVPRILRAKVRQACLDAKASEHGSRMTAMDAATKNSNELIYTLQLTINKLRQSEITGQLLDIVGGAEALSSQT